MRAGGKIVGLPAHDPGVLNDLDAGSTIAHLLTFGLVKAKAGGYMTLSGNQAATRVKEVMPEFLDLLAPLTEAPDNAMILVRMTPRGNTRFVQVAAAEVGLGSAAGRMAFGENIRVSVLIEKVADNCTWKGMHFSHYRMRPSAQLSPGEYGVILGNKIADFAVE